VFLRTPLLNDEIRITNDELNSKSEIRNPKSVSTGRQQAPNSNDQNSKQNKVPFKMQNGQHHIIWDYKILLLFVSHLIVP